MSAVALPTKPSGIRPPVHPPIGTAFNPFGDDSPEPFYKVVAESVRFMIKKAREADSDNLGTIRELLLGRKKMVESELQFERLFSTEPLPPLLANFYSLDFLGNEEDPSLTYIKLLATLDVAIEEVDRRIAALNHDSIPSDS